MMANAFVSFHIKNGCLDGKKERVMNYVFNDGGRQLSGFKGRAGDCAARALAIALELDYEQAYRIIAETNSDFGYAKSARNGIHKEVFHYVLKQLGYTWHPAPKFDGRKAKCSDMPKGVVIARQAKHFVAVIDGVPHDTWDSSNKMVYGYWAL